MKTVFKVGMVVYDQLNFPDKEGKVVDICKDERVTSPITVIFKDRYDGEIERYYTLDGRYKTGELTVLSTKPYQIILQGFEQKAPAPTYEDAQKWIIKQKEGKTFGELNEIDKNFINYSYYKAFESLKKLIILRDYYNEGWQPKNSSYVYIITTRNRKLVKDCLMGDFRVLYFKSQEISNRFFEEQKELLEIAKPLL